MSDFGRIAEEKIRKAMEAGEFDRLAGKGKPLPLEENPFEPEGMGAVYRLLKHNDYTLPWMEEGLEIERKRLLAHRALREASLAENAPELIRQSQEAFSRQIESLNREIIHYNLRVPGAAFQRTLLNVEAERAIALSAGAIAAQKTELQD
ncbi:MAG: DUF1992 domain-containing protein [Chloroflexi bacterium]|nr:DUF1992 domain-containing protein [Chloroflexota bacterium]